MFRFALGVLFVAQVLLLGYVITNKDEINSRLSVSSCAEVVK